MNRQTPSTSYQASEILASVPVGACFFLPIAIAAVIPTADRLALLSKGLIVGGFICSFLFLRRERRSALLPIVLAGLIYGSVAWSVCPSASLHTAIQITYYLLLFEMFRSLPCNVRSMIWGLRIVVGVSLILSLHGLVQLIFGYAEYMQYLNTNEIMSPMLKLLTRKWIIALSGRVFSRFALPSQFAGYLLLILPLNTFLVWRVRPVWEKGVWGGSLLLNIIMFVYTKSFGAWLSLIGVVTIGIAVWAAQKYPLTWRSILKGSILLLVGGGLIVYVIGVIRGQHLWDLQGNNPLWHRWLNWQTAFQILRESPFLGTGLLTYGKMYPQYMLPGANEAQYAHNSYLQLGAELGIVGLIFVIWLAVSWGIAAIAFYQSCSPDDSMRRHLGICCGFSGFAFLLHNVVDFDFYVFPLGILGISLLALTVNCLRPCHASNFSKPLFTNRRTLVGCGVLAGLLVIMYVSDWRYVQSQQWRDQAVASLQSARYQEASLHLQEALRYVPGIPEYAALEGHILLGLNQPEAAIQRFQAAINHEPETPWFHAGLADAQLATHNLSMAYVEMRRAAELFPQKAYYQERVAQLADWFSRR